MIVPITYSLWPGKGTPISGLLWEVSPKSLTACPIHAEVAQALPSDLLVEKTHNSLQTGLVIVTEARQTLPWSAFQANSATDFPCIHGFEKIRISGSLAVASPGFAPGVFAPPASRESRQHSQLLHHWTLFRRRAWGKALEEATGFFADLDVSPLIALARQDPASTTSSEAYQLSVPAMRSKYPTQTPGSYFDTHESSFPTHRVMNQPAAFGDHDPPPETGSPGDSPALSELRQLIRRHLRDHDCTSFDKNLLAKGDLADLIQLLLSIIP
jgi:hypothetical protein